MKAEKDKLYSKVSARAGMRGHCGNCGTNSVTERGDELRVMPVRNRRGHPVSGQTCLEGKCPECQHWIRFR